MGSRKHICWDTGPWLAMGREGLVAKASGGVDPEAGSLCSQGLGPAWLAELGGRTGLDVGLLGEVGREGAGQVRFRTKGRAQRGEEWKRSWGRNWGLEGPCEAAGAGWWEACL